LLDFPNAPTNGQIFTSGSQSWQWDGNKWIPLAAQTTIYVQKTGDSMSGALTLNADPNTALAAATKQYVDGRFVQMTQAAYNALGTKDATVLYVIVG